MAKEVNEAVDEQEDEEEEVIKVKEESGWRWREWKRRCWKRRLWRKW